MERWLARRKAGATSDMHPAGERVSVPVFTVFLISSRHGCSFKERCALHWASVEHNKQKPCCTLHMSQVQYGSNPSCAMYVRGLQQLEFIVGR